MRRAAFLLMPLSVVSCTAEPALVPPDPPQLTAPAYAGPSGAEDTRWKQMLGSVSDQLKPSHPDLDWRRRLAEPGATPATLEAYYRAALPEWTPLPLRVPGGWAFALEHDGRVLALFGLPARPGAAMPVGIVSDLPLER